MALDAEDVKRFAEVVGRVEKVQERLGLAPISGVSTATIAVNAGGVGVWIATTACIVMLGMVMVGAFWINSEFSRINTQFSDMKNTNDIQDAYITKLRAELKKENP